MNKDPRNLRVEKKRSEKKKRDNPQFWQVLTWFNVSLTYFYAPGILVLKF